MPKDTFSSVSGEVLYLHDDEGQVGHENFIVTKDLNQNRTLRAICQIYQENLLRDVTYTVIRRLYLKMRLSDFQLMVLSKGRVGLTVLKISLSARILQKKQEGCPKTSSKGTNSIFWRTSSEQ